MLSVGAGCDCAMAAGVALMVAANQTAAISGANRNLATEFFMAWWPTTEMKSSSRGALARVPPVAAEFARGAVSERMRTWPRGALARVPHAAAKCARGAFSEQVKTPSRGA